MPQAEREESNGSNNHDILGGAHMVDFHLPQRFLATRSPLAALGNLNVPAASIAAVAAGVLSLVVMLMLSGSVYDESAWKLPRMVAAILAGRGALDPDDEFSALLVGLAFVIHFALALVYTLAVAALVKDMPEAAAPWIGMAFGVALYFGNLYGFTRLFPWFAQLRSLDTLAVHVIFGIVAATAYRHFAPPADAASR